MSVQLALRFDEAPVPECVSVVKKPRSLGIVYSLSKSGLADFWRIVAWAQDVMQVSWTLVSVLPT